VRKRFSIQDELKEKEKFSSHASAAPLAPATPTSLSIYTNPTVDYALVSASSKTIAILDRFQAARSSNTRDGKVEKILHVFDVLGNYFSRLIIYTLVS
jgi:hypothetical protein